MHDDTDRPDSSHMPLSRIADLQAGLLDDDLAASVRQRARTELAVARQLAALDRVRRDVAELGVDTASAPAVPADVTARIGAALRALPLPTDGSATRDKPTSHRTRGARGLRPAT